MPRFLHHFVLSHILLKLSELFNLGRAMASLMLESDKAALAKSLGAVPKYPARQILLPTPKPKPRPQPTRDSPGTFAADPVEKRRLDSVPPCTCKSRRLIDAALARSLGAVPKYPAPPCLLPKPKPKPRAQPTLESPGTLAGDAGKKRRCDADAACSCKTRRVINALTDLDLIAWREAAKQK